MKCVSQVPVDWEYERVVMKVSDIASPDVTLGQRLPDKARVARMAKGYRPSLVRPPICARIKGRAGIHPADGGHTLAMLRELNVPTVAVDMHKGELSKEEFAALVARLNTERKALNAFEKFNAQRLGPAGDFPVAHQTFDVLKEFDFKLTDVRACIGDVQAVCSEGGPDRLRMVLTVIEKAFDAEPYAFRNSIPRALGDFFGRYGSRISMDHLVKRLKGYNIVAAAGDALAEGVRSGHTAGKRYTLLAEAIKRRYNTARPSGLKRLRLAS